MFNRVLIANRGEIAVRIARTCRALGIETVAVYSDADADALHLRGADRALHLGAAAPLESYLNIERIVAAAVESGAQALHPGYGFLAESEHLARACDDAGVVFVGPPAEAIEKLGHKGRARELALSCEVPVLPAIDLERGQEAAARAARLRAAATEVGYPLLIKAAAGGGGKGMRLVERPGDLEPACAAAGSEALAAFGSDELLVERYIARPRHVEVQVLGDSHGNMVHLFERECSIQRRHQKIVEEAPSPALTPELRTQMCASALRLARAGGYQNAGTVEFLLDARGDYTFLEMNTRLQVEHPVTEAITGIDLVAAQLRVAAGEELPWTQQQISRVGHALECRIYAEDPALEFAPSPGTLLFAQEPVGPGVRVDAGAVTGSEIPVHYDPIIAKLITWGEDRESARRRMALALREYPILGIETTIPFLHDLVESPAFIDGALSTRFIDEHLAQWTARRDALDDALIAFLADAASGARPAEAKGASSEAAAPESPWSTLGDWTL